MINRQLFKKIVPYHRYAATVVLIFCFLFIFIAGSLGPSLAASAQEVGGPKTGSNFDSAICEPMMSNVTIPISDEDVLPPKMYLVYKDEVHNGELSQSKYREGETFSDLKIVPEPIESQLPADTVEIKKDSCTQFVVKGTPRTLPPDSLDISAYTTNGTSVGVLNATEDNTSTFKINLPQGTYILLATATWIPNTSDEYVTGYVIYKYLANVTEN